MRLALEEARRAYEIREVPIGAVVVMDGNVISRAHNLRETENDPTAHAELLAIRQASQVLKRWRLNGCILYCTIEPCAMCAGALVLSRIDTLVFGANDAKAGACGSVMNIVQHPALNHRVEVIAGILADECSALMRKFFSEMRTEGCRSG
ncbi:MAG TPA: tRNA adenosine(34) deaminase TadA [Firmicutes bacterium]|nr:tRNA adenosine(34) deaminase TadA [Bacillota bacterium]